MITIDSTATIRGVQHIIHVEGFHGPVEVAKEVKRIIVELEEKNIATEKK